MSPEYRLQVKQTKVPQSVRHRPSLSDGKGYYIHPNDPNVYYQDLDIINEQNTDSEFFQGPDG